MHFLTYLLKRGIGGRVDFFDPGEVAQRYEVTGPNVKIEVTHVVGEIEDCSGYDVLIDDAFTFRKGIPALENVPKNFSLKGLPNQEPFRETPFTRFCHVSETRCFSTPSGGYMSACKCYLCTQISASVTDYEEYFFLRCCCYDLGHTTDYVPIVAANDLRAKAAVRVALLTTPFVPMRQGQSTRVVLALREEMPLKVENSIASLTYSSARGFVEFVHGKGFVDDLGTTPKINVPWLEGETVAFFGVAPSVLGMTRVHSPKQQWAQSFENVAFCDSFEVLPSVSQMKAVYMSKPLAECLTAMPTRRFSGRMVVGYREYVFCDTALAPFRQMHGIPFRKVGERSLKPLPEIRFLLILKMMGRNTWKGCLRCAPST